MRTVLSRLVNTCVLVLALSFSSSTDAASEASAGGLKKLSEYLQAEVEYIGNSQPPVLRIGKVRQFGPAIHQKVPTGAVISSFIRLKPTGAGKADRTTISVDDYLTRHAEWGSLDTVAAEWKCCPNSREASSADNTSSEDGKHRSLYLPLRPSQGLGEFIVFPGTSDPVDAQKRAYVAVLSALLGATFAPAPPGTKFQSASVQVVAIKPGGSFDLAGIKEGEILHGVGAAYQNPFSDPRLAIGAALKSLDGSSPFEILRTNAPRPTIVSIIPPGKATELAYFQPDNPKAVHARLTMFEKGDFGALEKALNLDLAFFRNSALKILWIAGHGPTIEEVAKQSRYSGFMAQYIHMKQYVLGDCGRPQKRYNLETTVVSALRNGFGQEFDRREDKSWSAHTVQADFYAIVEASSVHKVSNYAWRQLFDELKNETCNSPRLAAIEKNMIRFFSAR